MPPHLKAVKPARRFPTAPNTATGTSDPGTAATIFTWPAGKMVKKLTNTPGYDAEATLFPGGKK